MDDETKQKIFNPQHKISKSGTLGESGTGLGMLLCFEFIKLLNENIWVESEQDNYTEISFSLSLADKN